MTSVVSISILVSTHTHTAQTHGSAVGSASFESYNLNPVPQSGRSASTVKLENKRIRSRVPGRDGAATEYFTTLRLLSSRILSDRNCTLTCQTSRDAHTTGQRGHNNRQSQFPNKNPAESPSQAAPSAMQNAVLRSQGGEVRRHGGHPVTQRLGTSSSPQTTFTPSPGSKASRIEKPPNHSAVAAP